MMKSLTVINHMGDELEIDLRDPYSSGLLLYDMSGVGPGKANVHITEYATTDGGMFTNARLEPRNILLMFRYMDSPTIEESRHRSYRYFPIKKEITLIFTTSIRRLYIKGVVETNVPVIFQKESYAQVSIMCADPYFYSEEVNELIFSGLDPMFEFPFSNESLTEPLLIISDLKYNTQRDFNYYGEADVGITINIEILGSVHNITIWDVFTREHMDIDTNKVAAIGGGPLDIGDTIVINTEQGKKSISLLRDGVYHNILNSLSKGSDWVTLSQGENSLAYGADDGIDNMNFIVEYKTVYEGV